jgi:soluble lytic murein transglycosylase-like protein
MLSSALDLGVDQGVPAASRSLGVQGLLNKFLEQLPQTGRPASPPAVETSIAAEPERIAESVADSGSLLSKPQQTDGLIEKASRRYGVDSGLIKAIIKVESNFNPRAVSSAGAQGLMQLMPATARGLGVSNPFDPEQNVMAGTRFLKEMLQRYGGNLNDALAAYNWGPGNVDRHGSATLPKETRAYLSRVKGYYAEYL